MSNVVEKGGDGGDFCGVVSLRPQIALGFPLCQAVVGPLFPPRPRADIASELPHNRDLNLIFPRMKTEKPVIG